MDCERIKALLLSYMDDETDDDERKLVCAECTAEMEALAVTGSRLRQAYETVAAGVSPSPAVWQTIQDRVAAKQAIGESDADRVGSRWGWLFGWRHPVWRTAVAGAAMLSFMIVFAINGAPVSMWTAAEQQAIDIAANDPDVLALLDGQGVVYEVVPVNGDSDAELYQVVFMSSHEAASRNSGGYTGLEINTDSVSGEFNYSDGADVPLCFDALSTQSNAIVDVSNKAVVESGNYSVEVEADCLTAEQVQDAVQIAKTDSRIGDGARVINVALLNNYNSEQGEFTDEMVIWVRLSIDGDTYFAQVDLDEQRVVKIVDGGE